MRLFPLRYFRFLACLCLLVPGPAFAQAQAEPATPAPVMAVTAAPVAEAKKIFEIQARAADTAVLLAGKNPVRLWGIEAVEGIDPAAKLRARSVLDNAMGGQKITCELKAREGDRLEAQCVNAQDQDLALLMLQQGYVTVDRAAVYGTVYEDAYIQAETQAQDRKTGIWSEGGNEKGNSKSSDGTLMLGLGFVLFVLIIAAFTFLSIIIMRGFQKVIDAQTDNINVMIKERKLRDQERNVVAVMLDSELKSNKAKIEAYLAVYEEMHKSMSDPDRPPKYKKAGDIVQKQPALSRAVFDRNTDKLDILGSRLSSELVHFYARIKSNPEYANLEPEMDLAEALKLVEDALKNARRLDMLAGSILDAFAASGIMSQAYEE